MTPTTSPWGRVQDVTNLANGVASVSTAGHGGIKLSRERNAKMPAQARRRGGWYEEDCDWALAALVHPDAFSEHELERALATAKNWLPDEYTVITGEPLSLDESSALRRRKFEKESFDQYVARAAWGSWAAWVPDGKVGILAHRESDGAEVYALVPKIDYRAPYVLSDPTYIIPQPANLHEQKPKH